MTIHSLPPLGAALAALSLAGPLPALALDGTLARIAETGRITLGHRDAAVPFSYLDGDAQPVGFSMDLCRAVVEAVRDRLELPELETGDLTVTSQTRIPLMANGTIDLECGSTTSTLERQRQVAYGPTMVLAAGRFLVRADAGIEGPGDLAGRTVPAMQGSNPVQVLTRLNAERDLGLRMLSAKDFADSFLLLQTGRADAIAQDDIILAGMRATARDPQAYRIVGTPFTVEPYGIMLCRDDPAFKAQVDETVTGLMEDGRFADIYARWFEAPIPPRGVSFELPMSAQLQALVRHPADSGDPADY